MAEFLIRGYNVAMPEVDRGDDIFVVKDSDGELSRIQVKAARTRPTRRGEVAVFNLDLLQLQSERTPDLTYVLVTRTADRWGPFLVLPRRELYELTLTESAETVREVEPRSLVLRLRYVTDPRPDVWWGEISLGRWLDRWAAWPVIAH